MMRTKTPLKSKLSLAEPAKIAVTPDKSRERGVALMGLSPVFANANTAMTFAKGTFATDEKITLCSFIDVMEEKVDKVKSGDMSGLEATLTAQAITLDAVFNELAKRAANSILHMPTCETLLRLALKAQAQCRATIETLAEVKQPKSATFVKQQNVAYQQQVNNGENIASDKRTNSPSHGKNKSNRQNELLDDKDGKWLDGRTTIATIDDDTQMETMGAIDRSKNTRRKKA
jgi:hypothetical protein